MTPTNQKVDNIVDSRISPPSGTQSHPWLLMIDTKKRDKQVFYSISEGRYDTKNIPEIRNKRIFTYNKEWLVTIDYKNRECYLLNFVSMEKVKLPKYNRLQVWGTSCYLTSTPGDPNCHIVFLDLWNPTDMCLCQPGDDNFIKKEIVIPREIKRFAYVTFFNRSMYAVGNTTLSLLRANLNDLTIEFQTVFSGGSMQNMLLSDNALGYLIESCGELLLVMRHYLFNNICDFQVFRADFSRLEWEYLTDIGDRAIFLDALSTQGYSCSASESGIQENCIYYTEEENRLHYIFNLETETFTSNISCPTFDRTNIIQHWVVIPPTSMPCYHPKSYIGSLSSLKPSDFSFFTFFFFQYSSKI